LEGPNDPWTVGLEVTNDFLNKITFRDGKKKATLGDMVEYHFGEYFEYDTTDMNGAAMGLGLVYLLIETEVGDTFKDQLSTVPYDEAARAIVQSLSLPGKFIKYRDRDNIVYRRRERLNIPEHQVHVKSGIMTMQKTAACKPCVRHGGISAYNAIETMWQTIHQGKQIDKTPTVTTPSNGFTPVPDHGTTPFS